MDGYPKIAGLMSRHHELAIFRRFDELNYRNILYLQAELVQLEDELREIATQDQESPSRTLYARDWSSLAQSESEGDGRLQWQKVLLIREKLEKYSKLVLRCLCHLLYVIRSSISLLSSSMTSLIRQK